MKKRISMLLALLMICMLFSGCSPARDGDRNAGDAANAEGGLTIYALDSELWWKTAAENFEKQNDDVAVHVELFQTAEELEMRLNTELPAGGGPDLILYCPFTSDIDMQRMAYSGRFLALDEYFAADETFNADNYYAPVWEYGVFDGTRYVVSCGFTMPGIIATEQRLAEGNYAQLSGYEYTMKDLLACIMEEAGRLSGSTSDFAYYVLADNLSYSNYLSYSGLLEIDYAGRTLQLDKENIHELTDAYRVLYNELVRANEISQKAASVQDVIASGTFFAYTFDPANLMLSAATVMERDLNFTAKTFMLPRYERAGEYIAQSALEMAVNKNSENPELAYRFIRSVMDGPSIKTAEQGANSTYFYAINRGVCEGYIEKVPDLMGAKAPGKTAYTHIEPAISHALENMSGCRSMSRDVNQIIVENMMPYINGEDHFDTCYDNMLAKLQLYLTE